MNEEHSLLPTILQFWPRKQQLMEGKEEKEKEASRFRGRAGEGKILTELLWRTWSRFLAIVPSPEERGAPLTDSSSLVQSPPLCAEWTAHSVLPPPPPSTCFSPYHMRCFFKVKFTASSPFPLIQPAGVSLTPPLISSFWKPLVLWIAILFFSWSTFCELFLFV